MTKELTVIPAAMTSVAPGQSLARPARFELPKARNFIEKTHGNQKHKNGPFQSAILKQSPRDRRIHNGNTFRIKGMSECGRS
jgi:hypothetical protein